MSNSLTHVLPYPIKNCRFTLLLAFRTSAGTPTDPTTPDTEVSTDGGATFSDCTEEITTGGSNGAGYLTLTSTETNNNAIFVAAKSANCVTTLAVLYPRDLVSVSTGTLSAGSAGGGTLGTILPYDITDCFIKTTGGTGGAAGSLQARRIATYNTSTGAFTVTPNWETTPDNTTTYSILLPDGVTVGMLQTMNPATAGRKPVVDAAGLIDANAVKLGPSGSGTAQTARDIGANVLLSSGTGAGQLDITSGVVKANTTQVAGAAQTAGDLAAMITAVDDFIDTEVAAIISELEKVPKSDSTVSFNATALAAIADALLDRNMATGTDSGSPTVRTMRQALRAIRNKWSISGGTLTVTKEDDTTTSWTSSLTGTAGADPITTSDPA